MRYDKEAEKEAAKIIEKLFGLNPKAMKLNQRKVVKAWNKHKNTEGVFKDLKIPRNAESFNAYLAGVLNEQSRIAQLYDASAQREVKRMDYIG